MRNCIRILGMAAATGLVLAFTTGMAMASHGNIILYDKTGNPITYAERFQAPPVSTEKTCFAGDCHGGFAGYLERSSGFHIQQGANEYNKSPYDGNNWVTAGRAFVRSPGMFGKW